MSNYILIAEDDRDISLLMERKLQNSGYHHIQTIFDGAEALKQALAAPPILLILDIMLPSIDGLTICAEVKNQLGDQAPLVLITSAKGQEDDLASAKEAGADSYLIKPFHPSDFVDEVQKLIG